MKINKKNIIAILISIIFIVIIFHNIDFARLVNTFKLFNYKIILLIVPLFLIAMLLRGLRWKYILHNDKTYSAQELTEVYILGAALNIYLPARAGDFFRAYFLGKKHNKSKLKLFASIVLERVFDGLATLSILILAVSLYHKTRFGLNLSIISGTIFIGAIIALYLLYKFNKTDKICSNLKNFSSKFSSKIASMACTLIEKINTCFNSFIEGLESLAQIKTTLYICGLSAVIWSIECLMTYLVIINFGYDVSFSISLFVISFIAFATVIPSTSIFIGPYQYAFILALAIYKIDKSQALAIAFTQQIITLLIITTVSFLIVMKNNMQDRDIIIEEIKEAQNAHDN